MENRIKMGLQLKNRLPNYQKLMKSIIKSDKT